jgi:hypothetical protein
VRARNNRRDPRRQVYQGDPRAQATASGRESGEGRTLSTSFVTVDDINKTAFDMV